VKKTKTVLVPLQFRKETDFSELTSCQKSVLDSVKTYLDSGKLQFLCAILGYPGVGKTRVIVEIGRLLQVRGKCFSYIASTGISASRIPEGVTIHSFFHIPVRFEGSYEELTSSLKISKGFKENVQGLNALILDECSFVSCSQFQFINKRLQLVNGNKLPFAGIHRLETRCGRIQRD
jgi:DNA replication protein DnaC